MFGDDFLDASVNVSSDPRFAAADYVIVDVKDVDEFPVDSETIRQIARSDSHAFQLNADLKLAVVSSGQTMDSLAHMYKMYFELYNDGNAWDIALFESEKQAWGWISGADS